MVGRLLGPAQQCRHLRAQPRQRRPCAGPPAGLAQRLGHPAADANVRRGGARARPGPARAPVRGDPGRIQAQQPVRDAVPADRGRGLPGQRPWLPARADRRHELRLQGRQDLNPRLSSLARGALALALTCLGLLAVTFFIGRVIPVDPALAVAGERASEAQLQRARLAMGLDRPLPLQFARYVSQVLHGDLGVSVLTTNPVTEDIARTFPATLELATCGILLGAGLGIPLGVWAAVRRAGLVDHAVRLIGLVGYSVPIFWLGLMGLLLFYARLGWVGGPGRIDVAYLYEFARPTGLMLLDAALAGRWDAFANALSHLVLPASLLGYFSLAYISRMTRSFMLGELASEYVVAARAKGLSEARIVWRHALRNALVPLLTVVVLSYAGLLEGSVLTETVFGWPGLGLYITNALQNADMNAVLGGTLVVGSVFIALNLASDMLYRLLDPRTKDTR
ncbi:MAG: ABC transporter permease [Burkholderiales bacterium]|nr:ABC transporter permease [Burkholderiales bacterium]MDE1927323.1 ABC transporter permease [Burkholderiales bacterium]MDE2160483.1 ABC transporter permease [Burkholderiales bacterium]MDE2503021.1 ABC transporter permease [Burkholderiales bacterium]